MLADELHQEVSFQGHAKGVYGGGDLLRPRTGHRNGVSSLLLRPSSIFSTAIRTCCSKIDHLCFLNLNANRHGICET
jgi:hypothetical protein